MSVLEICIISLCSCMLFAIFDIHEFAFTFDHHEIHNGFNPMQLWNYVNFYHHMCLNFVLVYIFRMFIVFSHLLKFIVCFLEPLV